MPACEAAGLAALPEGAVNMKTLLLAAALAAASPLAAHAVTVAANQGLQGDGAPVAADRSNIDSVLDVDVTEGSATFFSLGLGGFISLDTSPRDLKSPTLIIEITNGTPNASFPEAAKLILGGTLTGPGGLSESNAFSGGIEIGTLSNNASLTVASANGAVITKTQTGRTSRFVVDFSGVAGGPFTRITLLDVSPTQSNTDGFDVGAFSVETVPPPASALLLLGGLAGLGFVSRRRAAA